MRVDICGIVTLFSSKSKSSMAGETVGRGLLVLGLSRYGGVAG